MIQYPDCPKCTNTTFSIVDVEVDGMKLKGIKCNSCREFLGFFQDTHSAIEKLQEKIDDLESETDDLQSCIDTINAKLR